MEECCFAVDLSSKTLENSAKKRKLSSNEERKVNDGNEKPQIKLLKSLKGFRDKRILSENEQTKTMFIEGSIDGSEEPAILLLEKQPFSKEIMCEILSEQTRLVHVFHNDIYASYDGFLNSSVNGIKATVIHPATEKHIEKYMYQPLVMVQETPDLYETVVLPYLESQQLSLQWVENILEHKEEADRIVYEDPDPDIGFIMMPDMKWDEDNVDFLHVLALCRIRGIKTLRDLTADHLPLLWNIQKKGLAAIFDKYKLPECHLRIFMHYQPSYYHLHVHFTSVQNSPAGTEVEKAHLLSTVISNLTLFPDYYKKITLNYAIKENDPLCKKLKEAGVRFYV